jgi:Cdc6-like AAA superfamily ATPase
MYVCLSRAHTRTQLFRDTHSAVTYVLILDEIDRLEAKDSNEVLYKVSTVHW